MPIGLRYALRTMIHDDITALLNAWSQGDAAALEAAMPGLYDTLRRIALRRISDERDMVTLEPTDLVHEAMVRMLGNDKPYANRLHFQAVAALYMRSILTDRARAIQAGRRPSACLTVALSQAGNMGVAGDLDLLTLDTALRALEAEDARAARAFELSAFSGMLREDIAELLSVSVASVDRDLRFARAWFNEALA